MKVNHKVTNPSSKPGVLGERYRTFPFETEALPYYLLLLEMREEGTETSIERLYTTHVDYIQMTM